MKRALGLEHYSIVIGAIFVATAAVLGFIKFFGENVLGTSYPNISPTHLITFLGSGIVLISLGAKSLIAELRKKKGGGEK